MYKLTYWPKRGRGEQVRLLLAELDAPWEDLYTSRGEGFEELQAEGPSKLWFGSIPWLQDGDFGLVQGPVILSYLARKHGMAPDSVQDAARADAIALGAEDLRMAYFKLFGPGAARAQKGFVDGFFTQRWLPRVEGLLAIEGTGWFVGDDITHADIAMWDAHDAILEWVAGATLDGFPLLTEWFARVRARPRIAAYLASDRRMTS